MTTRRTSSPRLRRFAASFAAAVLLACFAAIPAASPVAASAPPITAGVVDGVVFGASGDTVTGVGTANHIYVTFYKAAGTTTLTLDGPGGGPIAGSWDIGTYTMVVGSTACSTGHVTVLAPLTFDGGGNLTSVALDFTCDSTHSGSLRINTTEALTALEAVVSTTQYGTVDAGSLATKSVTYQNVGTMPFALGATYLSQNAQTSGLNEFQLGSNTCTATLLAGASCAQDVMFRPVVSGLRAVDLTLPTTPAAPGSTTTLQGVGHFAAAANDSYASPAEVASLGTTWYGDVTNATSDRLDPVCLGGWRKSVWFHYHADADGPITVDTAPSTGEDTVLGVYSGSAPDGLTLVSCSDDVSASDLTSRVNFPGLAGTDYWVMVSDATGTSVSNLVVRFTSGQPDSTAAMTSWTIQYPTIYPYVDGYRDTDIAGGTPAEPVFVTVDVVPAAATSTILRHADLGLRDRAFAFKWNATNNASTRVADGAYLIRYHVTDAFGNTAGYDFPVTVSSKRIYYATASTYVYGSKTSYKTHAGSGSAVTISGSTAVLKSGYGYAVVQYKVVLPSQPVYKTVKVEVTGKSSNGKTVVFYGWNGTSGTWDGAKRTGSALATYVGPSLAASSHVSGRTMYAMVLAQSTGSPIVWTVSRITIVYTYGYLK